MISDLERAHELTGQIRELARHAHVVLEALYLLVEEARSTRVHETLGYPSWTAYLADNLDGQWKLEPDKRGEAMRFLAGQGMSTRAIARVTGVSHMTASRELRGLELGPVMGLDGKSYVPDRTGVTGRYTFTIPDTIEGAHARLDEIAAEEEQLKAALNAADLAKFVELDKRIDAADLQAALADSRIRDEFREMYREEFDQAANGCEAALAMMRWGRWEMKLLLAEGAITVEQFDKWSEDPDRAAAVIREFYESYLPEYLPEHLR